MGWVWAGGLLGEAGVAEVHCSWCGGMRNGVVSCGGGGGTEGAGHLGSFLFFKSPLAGRANGHNRGQRADLGVGAGSVM